MPQKARPGAWLGLAVCTLATAVLQIDGTMVTVALPTLGRELGIDATAGSWVLIAYFLPFAAMLLPGGRLVDRLGARRVAGAGLLLFAAGAVLGALAPSFGALVASRVLQGLAAGVVSPAALAGAMSGFPPSRRGTALGIWGAGSGSVGLLGPLTGGLLTSTLGWRSNWWALLAVSVAVGVAMTALAPGRAVEAAPAPEDRRPDAGRVVAVSTALIGATFLVITGAFLLGQEYLQQIAGESALSASATLMVGAVASAITTPLGGWVADRGSELLPISTGVVIAGAALAVLGTGAVPLRAALTAVPLLAVGAGIGLLFGPISRAALNAAGAARHGRASAWLAIGRLAGATLGAGLAGAAGLDGLSVAHVSAALLGAAAVCAAALLLTQLLRAPRDARRAHWRGARS